MIRLWRILLWAAVATTLWFALAPLPPTVLSSDKHQHELAFATLTLLAAMAYPRFRWRWHIASLAAFGGAIELLQLIPALGRDADPADWLADLAAVAAATAVIAIVRLAWRRSSLS